MYVISKVDIDRVDMFIVVMFPKYTVQTNLIKQQQKRRYCVRYLAYIFRFILTKISYYMRNLKLGDNRSLNGMTEAKFELISFWL